MTTPITQGDREPSLVFTIGDERDVADFSEVVPGMVHITAYLGGAIVLEDIASTVTPAEDGKSATVIRTWKVGETDLPGLWRILCQVEWSDDRFQTFPAMNLEVKKRNY